MNQKYFIYNVKSTYLLFKSKLEMNYYVKRKTKRNGSWRNKIKYFFAVFAVQNEVTKFLHVVASALI